MFISFSITVTCLPSLNKGVILPYFTIIRLFFQDLILIPRFKTKVTNNLSLTLI